MGGRPSRDSTNEGGISDALRQEIDVAYREQQIIARALARDEVVVGEAWVTDFTFGTKPPAARTAWMVVTDQKVVLAFGGTMLGRVTVFRYEDVVLCGYDVSNKAIRAEWLEPDIPEMGKPVSAGWTPGLPTQERVIVQALNHFDLGGVPDAV